MGSRLPSRTIAPGIPGRKGLRRRGERSTAPFWSAALCSTAALLLLALTVGAACADSEPAAVASSGDVLLPGFTYAADLDGDPEVELIRIDGAPASVTLTDGDLVYKSRGRWRVVQAGLGDLDRNGLLEVVALLESDEGRHIGLFAYFGGEYRERLVTSALAPPPASFQVVDGTADGGDLLVLTGELKPDGSAAQTSTYRWNGFGFTAIGSYTTP
jgi:hypothetical protein